MSLEAGLIAIMPESADFAYSTRILYCHHLPLHVKL